MSDDVIVETEGAVGRIRLNRPRALHALDPAMVAAMFAALVDWARDDSVQVVMLDHAEGRGFCAGGDIRFLADSAHVGGEAARGFFREEYRLNAALFGYAKPTIVFMDGVTMGGGCGIALPCRLRVATENTRLAMPESGIGLFPDVGGGWHLSRLPGRVGRFLALTGARLDGAECHALGLATHYLPAAALEDAKRRIIAKPADAAAVLDALAVPPPRPRILDNRAQIDRLFASDRLEDVFAALAADGSDWASTELATLHTKCPTTMKVALRQLAEAARKTRFEDDMAMEYRIAARVVMRPDFAEGVRAVVIDKDNAPRWDPATPDAVTDASVDAIFAPLAPHEEWTPA